MRKIFCLMLAAALCFGLCACSGGDAQGSEGSSGHSSFSASPVSAQDYYRYINEQLLTDADAATGHLASTETLEIPFNYSGAILSVDIGNKGGLGLLSAMIEDFDGDGCLEMLAITAEHMNMLDTIWRKARDDNQPYDTDDSVLAIRGYLFDYGEEGIYRRSLADLCFIQNHHFGYIFTGIEKIEDRYYVFSRSSSENLSTYGVCPYTVCELGVNGLYMVHCSPLSLGNFTTGNTLQMLNIDEPMDVTHSSLHDLPLSESACGTADNARSSLGQRLLCFVEIDYTQWGGDTVDYTVTDYTQLRTYLPDNGQQWQKIDLPLGKFYEKPQTNAFLEALTVEIAADAGITYSYQKYMELDGVPTMNCGTEKGYNLILQCDPQTQQILTISMDTVNNPDSQWNDIKATILKLDELGLTQDQINPLMATYPSLDYMQGKQIGNWIISAGSAGPNTWFQVTAD